MKQNFVRFSCSDDVLRGKVKNILKAEPMCINHTVRTFVENHSTLATSCSLKPAVPKYIFPDFDTLDLALLRNSSQDARYRQIEKKGRVHWTSTREKFRANCVDGIFFWGVVYHLQIVLEHLVVKWMKHDLMVCSRGNFLERQNIWKGCPVFFFTGRNVLNGNLCFISKIASLSELQALGLICVNNWPKPWTVSCPCKWQTN